MLTRIQLNLLGRRSYLSSVVSLATGSNTGAISLENKDDDNDDATEAYGDDFEVNRKYLTFSWWLLNKGWVDVMQRVEAAVRQVFGQLSPRDQLTYETFSNMTAQVRKVVEGGGSIPGLADSSQQQHHQRQQPGAAYYSKNANWLAFLLPPPDMEDYVLRESGILDDSATFATQQGNASADTFNNSSLRHLLDETSDLIETPTFTHVLTQILDAGFTTLLDRKLAPGAFDLDLTTDLNTTTPSSPPPAAQFLVRDEIMPNNELIDDRRRKATEKKVLLPKCLSVLTRQAHAIGDALPTNEYLAAMEQVRDLEGFAAVVYSSNWENEIREAEGIIAAPAHSDSSSNRGGGGTTTTTNALNSVRQSQHLAGGEGGAGEESLVLVDPSQSSFESVWAKVTEK